MTDDPIEAMAEVIHEAYLRERMAEGLGPDDHPAARPWAELSPQLRAQNRDQARDNLEKLAAIGLRIEAAGSGDATAEPAVLTEAQELTLARLEHERWAAQKRDQGYRYGPERVDAPPDRRHPDLVAWEELSPEAQEKDRAPMRRIPELLAQLGYRLVDDGTGS